MRRRARDLMPRIATFDNVWAAWLTTRRGKRRTRAVAGFEMVAEREVLRLAAELADGTWRPGRGRVIHIRHPKRRLVHAVPIADRVVHQAVHQHLAPVLERSLTDDCFACRPGLGTHRAVLQFQADLRRHAWVARLDLCRYFLEIRWDHVLDLFRARVDDAALEAIVTRVMASGSGLYHHPPTLRWLGIEDVYRPEPRKGLIIGSLLSQLFANTHLDGLDHYARRDLHLPAYIRYLDDIAVFGRRRGDVSRATRGLRGWLVEHRGLEARLKLQPSSTRGRFEFLGVGVDRERRWPSARARRGLKAKARNLARSGRTGPESATLLAAHIRSLAF